MTHDDIFIEPEEEESSGFTHNRKEKKLKEELKKCREERQEYLLGWQRSKADLINARREFEVRLGHIIKEANKDLILELLLITDSFDMAFSNKDLWQSVDENWRRGIEHIYSQFETILRGHGVEIIEPSEGEIFNTHLHESVEAVKTDRDESDHTVASILQKGYMLHGVIIRPARVRVYTL